MADYRVINSIYGHPGLAHYDIDTKIWSFCSSYEEDLYIEQVEPLTEILPPCIEDLSTSDERPSVIIRQQSNTLFKALPELYSSKDLITTLLESQFYQVSPLFNGPIFAVGYAKDTKQICGSRRPLIFASTYGSAAHTLQLLMPRYETCRWDKYDKTRISLLSSSIADRAFWTNGKGTIRQISFSDTLEEKSTWLAARQDCVITVFRPFLSEASSYSWTTNTSLHSNPVAIISSGDNVNFIYSDISFNPWYPRQLATINSRGCWTIYDLEKSHRKGPLQKVRQKVTGDFYDSCNSMPTESQPSCSTDGWHRIFWICNISTIVICNRSYLAIFDIKSTMVKLQTPTLIPKESEDHILDIKRSSLNSDELFVLTTSQIFWMQVIPRKSTPHDENFHFGGKIILSCRHFRSPNDESLNLVPVTAGKVSLLLTSAKHPVISFYFFGREAGGSSFPKALQCSLSLTCIPGINPLIVSACFLPCTIIFNPSDDVSNYKAQCSNEEIEFYQIWFLTPTLQLVSTLCAVRLLHIYEVLSPISQTKPLDKKKKKITYRMNRRLTEDSFIVPDELKYDKLDSYRAQGKNISSVGEEKIYEDLRLRLDWRSLFQTIFPYESKEGDAVASLSGCKIQTTAQFLTELSDQINKGLKDDSKSMILIYDICNFNPISEDLRQVETIMKNFFDSLHMNSDMNNSKSLALKQISLFSGAGLVLELGEALNLSHIFHQLIEIWISVLPKDVPNRFRGVRLKLVRKLALDLYMSSIGLFFEDKTPRYQNTQVTESQELSQPGMPEIDISEKSTMLFTCQKAAGQEYGGADNQYHASSITKSDDLEILLAPETSSEDPAFSRIRQFAISVKSSSKFKRPMFLNEWSSTPGCDPDIAHSYNGVYNFSRSDNEKTSREESRRQRKANKSLCQQSFRSHQSILQPSSVIRDSTAEISASQPSMNFNDIINANNKRKSKKKRTAGF